MKENEKELLIAILKSNLSPKFKEEMLREMFMPKITYQQIDPKIKFENKSKVLEDIFCKNVDCAIGTQHLAHEL